MATNPRRAERRVLPALERSRVRLVRDVAGLLAALALAAAAHAQRAPAPAPVVVVYGGDRGFAPFEYLDDHGQPAGFNVDLLRELGRLAGVRVEIRLTVWNDVIRDLDAGRIDLVSLAFSDRRGEQYTWLARTWTLSQALVYPLSRIEPPRELDRLERETVAVERRSLMHELLQELPEVRRPALILAPSQQDAMRLLVRGDATAVAGNALTLKRAARTIGANGLQFVETKALTYGFATRHGHEAAVSWIEPALAEAREQGTVDRFVERHLADRQDEPSWQRIVTLARVLLPVLAVVVALVVFWNRSLRAQVRARQAAVERAARLQAVTQALARPLHSADVATAIIAEATDALGAYGAFVAMARADEGLLEILGMRGYPAGLTRERQFSIDDRLPAAVAVRTGEPLFIESPEQLARGYPELAAQTPSKAIAALPLDAGGRTVGVIGLGFRAPKRFSVDERALAVAIARQSAVALERARLYDAERAARAEAEAANRAKDEFLATLSHELRTPLNAILGWSHMLRSNLLPGERIPHALDTIERNAQIQVQLIGDLLDVSRAVRGTLFLELTATSLREAVEAAVDSVRPMAQAKHLALHLEGATGDAAIVRGDPARLQQVFWNLLSNAIKFTPNGGRIDVDLASGQDEVSVVVRDTGEGIPAERLPHVFERFYQGDASPTREHSGLGLGLAIVRYVVDQHGGTVSASSDGPGRGSLFTVSLPRYAPELAHAEVPAAGASAQG